jgi:hypothetical protein
MSEEDTSAPTVVQPPASACVRHEVSRPILIIQAGRGFGPLARSNQVKIPSARRTETPKHYQGFPMALLLHK